MTKARDKYQQTDFRRKMSMYYVSLYPPAMITFTINNIYCFSRIKWVSHEEIILPIFFTPFVLHHVFTANSSFYLSISKR